MDDADDDQSDFPPLPSASDLSPTSPNPPDLKSPPPPKKPPRHPPPKPDALSTPELGHRRSASNVSASNVQLKTEAPPTHQRTASDGAPPEPAVSKSLRAPSPTGPPRSPGVNRKPGTPNAPPKRPAPPIPAGPRPSLGRTFSKEKIDTPPRVETPEVTVEDQDDVILKHPETVETLTSTVTSL